MECVLILTQIRLALVFFVIHKDIGSLFGVLGWKYILSKKISCGTVNYPEAIKIIGLYDNQIFLLPLLPIKPKLF